MGPVGQDVTQNPEPETRDLPAEISDLVGPLLKAEEEQAAQRTDERLEVIRDFKDKINTLFWEYLFDRLRRAAADSETDEFVFSDDDIDRFNFGWIDERTYPRADLRAAVAGEEELPNILTLTQWLMREDHRNMEVSTRGGITDRIHNLTARVARIQQEIKDAQNSRSDLIRAHFGDKAPVLLKTARELEDCEVIIGYHGDRRKTRSIAKEDVKEMMERARRRDQLKPEWERLLAAINPAAGEMLAFVHRDAIQKRLLAVRMVQEIQLQESERTKAQERVTELLASRRVYMEERLREIRSDIVLCSRWGRTESHSVLLSKRDIYRKQAVLDAIETIVDFDPNIFDNRKVKREGRPLILMTPGTGNGSYDFRTNTLIVPVSSPGTLLESVAFALALYRRDVDQEFDESQLWKSFYDDKLWRRVKNRAMPKRFKDQMYEFVHSYVKWITRESKGMRVLESEIRGWFEEKIAPNHRALMVPRDLRGVRGGEADKALEDLAIQEPSPEIRYRQAVLKFGRESYDETIQFLDEAMAMDPSRPDVWWGLGILYSVLDDKTIQECGVTRLRGVGKRKRAEIAAEHFNKYVTDAPQSWWTLKAQDHLRRVRESMRG